MGAQYIFLSKPLLSKSLTQCSHCDPQEAYSNKVTHIPQDLLPQTSSTSHQASQLKDEYRSIVLSVLQVIRFTPSYNYAFRLREALLCFPTRLPTQAYAPKQNSLRSIKSSSTFV